MSTSVLRTKNIVLINNASEPNINQSYDNIQNENKVSKDQTDFNFHLHSEENFLLNSQNQNMNENGQSSISAAGS